MDKKPKVRALQVHPIKVEGKEAYHVHDPLGIMAEEAVIPLPVAFLLQFMDGTRTSSEIELRFTLETGQTLAKGQMDKLVEELDQKLFLEGPSFETAKTQMIHDFHHSPTRPAALAGTGYPEQPEELLANLKDILGPALKKNEAPQALRGLISPHIDLHRGRKGYRAAYGRLAHAQTFVLFGTSHNGATEPLIPTKKDFVTPLGRVTTDQEVLDHLMPALGEIDPAQEFLHRSEHSLEFQVLFLQALFPDKPFSIVPILTGPLPPGAGETPRGNDKIEKIVTALKEAIQASSGRVVLVAGADLAHIGPHFGAPSTLTQAQLADLEREDKVSLDHLTAGDGDAFFQNVAHDGNARNVCGLSPIYMVLRCLEPCRGDLFHYEQACAEDGSQCVSFAALGLV